VELVVVCELDDWAVVVALDDEAPTAPPAPALELLLLVVVAGPGPVDELECWAVGPCPALEDPAVPPPGVELEQAPSITTHTKEEATNPRKRIAARMRGRILEFPTVWVANR
jgi:hypothetical protein